MILDFIVKNLSKGDRTKEVIRSKLIKSKPKPQSGWVTSASVDWLTEPQPDIMPPDPRDYPGQDWRRHQQEHYEQWERARIQKQAEEMRYEQKRQMTAGPSMLRTFNDVRDEVLKHLGT